jgi:hypothetical protein
MKSVLQECFFPAVVIVKSSFEKERKKKERKKERKKGE